MGYSEASHWLACLSARDLKRTATKQLLWRWCVQGARSVADLYAAKSQEITEFGLDILQHSQLCASQPLVAEQAALLDQLETEGIKLLTRADTAYPETLTQRLPEERLPYLLYYRGNLDLLNLPGIALTGSGQPGEAAHGFAVALSNELALHECVFIGGYNKGIDRTGLETGLSAGANCILVLPLGLRPGKRMMSLLEPYVSAGKLLVISPYSCDNAYSDPQASARLPVIAGLSEMLLAIEPEDAPDAWVLPLHAPLPRLGVWKGAATTTCERWQAQGAITLATVDEVQQEWLKVVDGVGVEPATGLPSANTTAEKPIAFVDADSAIETLSHSGIVPAVLARRLRERAPEWGR